MIKPKSIGFTGTRNGMTEQQKTAFLDALWDCFVYQAVEFHSGKCVGADFQAVHLVEMHACEYDRDIVQHFHPGRFANNFEDTSMEASVCLHPGTTVFRHPPRTRFKRSRIIVDACELLIAAPPCKPLPDRGGTLYTINYARKQGRPLVILWPDGTTSEENMT